MGVIKQALKYRWQLGVILALIAVIIGLNMWVRLQPEQSGQGTSQEIQNILATNNKQERIKFYRLLLERVGPVEAQEQLFRSGLPFTGETHLLNHTAGDYIYEKHGVEGITLCRTYFLESCYHGLLLHVISGEADNDMVDIKKIIEHCQKEGPGVPLSCAHGIGHGYVAAVGYANLTKGLEQCDKLGANIPSFPLYNCLDGAFMENVWGLHSGAPSPDRWVKPGDDSYPCNDTRLKPEYTKPCWNNQPQILYQRYFGDLVKIGQICLGVAPEVDKESCFYGLSNQIHPLTENQTPKVISLCDNLPADWRVFCYITIVKAAFSVGDRSMPYEMCAQLTDLDKSKCYQHLSAVISIYTTSQEEQQAACDRIHEADANQRQPCKRFGG